MSFTVQLLNGEIIVFLIDPSNPSILATLGDVRFKLTCQVQGWEHEDWIDLHRYPIIDEKGSTNLHDDVQIVDGDHFFAIYVPPKIWMVRWDDSEGTVMYIDSYKCNEACEASQASQASQEWNKWSDLVGLIPQGRLSRNRFIVDVDSFPNDQFVFFYKFNQVVTRLVTDLESRNMQDLFTCGPMASLPFPSTYEPSDATMDPFRALSTLRVFVTEMLVPRISYCFTFSFEEIMFREMRRDYVALWRKWLDGVCTHEQVKHVFLGEERWLHHFRELMEWISPIPGHVDEVADIFLLEMNKVQQANIMPTRIMMTVFVKSVEMLFSHGADRKRIRDQMGTFREEWQTALCGELGLC